MLKELRICNLVLIEEAELSFLPGFNVISGETGAGKSAVTSALSLALGVRGDASLIRKGCHEGSVEALFEDGTLIRREINAAGRGRCTLNGESVSARVLRDLAPRLVDLVGQHANQQLRSAENHRLMLDLYGDVNSESFRASWSELNQLTAELNELVQHEALYLRERDRLAHEITEIETVDPAEGEDDELFEEYSRLSKGQEQLRQLVGVNDGLSQLLNRAQGLRTAVEKSADPETGALFKQALVEIEEVAYTLTSRQAELECDPERFQEIDARLSSITRLKRKYGKTVAEITEYLERGRDRVKVLDSYDIRREELRRLISAATQRTESAAASLSEARNAAAKRCAKEMTGILRQLNMPQADFTVMVKAQPRNSHGDEQIEFFLAPNKGEEAVSVAERVSGGELARVMLALKTLLAGKEEVGTLIFDEIDANIGGETATLIGARMRDMGKRRQVICITHFPQVAEFADRHLQVSKVEVEGRTVSMVRVLEGEERPKEIARMLGKRKK